MQRAKFVFMLARLAPLRLRAHRQLLHTRPYLPRCPHDSLPTLLGRHPTALLLLLLHTVKQRFCSYALLTNLSHAWRRCLRGCRHIARPALAWSGRASRARPLPCAMCLSRCVAFRSMCATSPSNTTRWPLAVMRRADASRSKSSAIWNVIARTPPFGLHPNPPPPLLPCNVAAHRLILRSLLPPG